MNNSFLAAQQVNLTLDEPVFDTESIAKHEVHLVKVIEAIRAIKGRKEWSTLKKEVFDDLVASLDTMISHEAKKPTPDVGRLNRLSGQLMWAERYSDLDKLETAFQLELKNLRQIHGTTKIPA